MTTTTPRPRRADAKRNRDALLDVALRLFSQSTAEVPLEQVAKEAGVGVGTLYRHFPTRGALIAATYRREVEALCGSADELLGVEPADAALRDWMGRFVAYVATKRGMKAALQEAVEVDADVFSSSKADMLAAVTRLVQAGEADGTLRPDADPETVMRALMGIFPTTDAEGWQDRANALLDLLLDGLRYGAAGKR